MNARRTKLQIYMDILQSIKKASGSLKKTHIVYKANLTHKRVRPYLDFLLSNDFLRTEKRENTVFFVITEKGIDFLFETRKLKEISDAFGLPLY